MFAWLEANGAWLGWLGAVSLLTFVGSLALIPVLVARIPADYFTHRHRAYQYRAAPHPALRLIAIVLKNLLGYLLILAGIIMLVLPGQGILTILIGVILIDFPGKYALEKKLVARPSVIGSINWLRARSNRAPLDPPADGD